MLVADKQVNGCTEQYIVKFWYTCSEGWYRQGQKEFWSNSKCAHKRIEEIALVNIRKEGISDPKIISVIYQ